MAKLHYHLTVTSVASNTQMRNEGYWDKRAAIQGLHRLLAERNLTHKRIGLHTREVSLGDFEIANIRPCNDAFCMRKTVAYSVLSSNE